MATVGDVLRLFDAVDRCEEVEADVVCERGSDRLGHALIVAMEEDFGIPNLFLSGDVKSIPPETPLPKNSQDSFDNLRNWLKAYSSHFDNL